MATFNLDNNEALYQIRAYQPGSIRINDQTLHASVIVTPNQLIENWAPQTVQALSAQSWGAVLNLHPDILLIGTGDTQVFLPAEIYGELINQGIGVEVMDTRAACRTYNALTAENRNVVAALIV
jgi:uncharacterized protein